MKKLLALMLAAALALSLVACGGGGTGDNNTSGGMTKEEMLRESVAITFEDLPGSGNMAKAKQEIGKIYRICQTVSNIEEDYCELCPVIFGGVDQGRDTYTSDEATVVRVYLPQETLAQLHFNDTIAIVGEISDVIKAERHEFLFVEQHTVYYEMKTAFIIDDSLNTPE